MTPRVDPRPPVCPPAAPPGVARHIPAVEAVRLALRPSLWFIAARSAWVLVACVLLVVAVRPFARLTDNPQWNTGAMLLGIVIALLWVLWQTLEWSSRQYALTDRRLLAVGGVLRQGVSDVPLRNVCNLVITRGLIERLLGLGTLGAATAGTSGYELVWVMVARVDDVLAVVRAGVDDAAKTLHFLTESQPVSAPAQSQRPLVLGLAGGIGAGKTAVAKVLADMGFVIIDSDKDARQALEQPEVRAALVEWWGPHVLKPDASIDRSRVAAIVFADSAQRTRLEALVHPLIKGSREAIIARAAADGRPGVVIDAPLLFEAGSNKECDGVLFIDAPRTLRLERVAANRGWDEAELARREAAQLPLEKKREWSDEVIVNDGPPERLIEQIRHAVARLRQARDAGR